MRRWPRWLRWLLVSLGGSALAAAVFISLVAQQNPNATIRTEPRILIFLDPLVIAVAAFVAVPSALGAFALAVLWLDNTVMWKTTALMYSAVLLELALVGPRDLDRALFFAYPTLLAAAGVSRLLFKTPLSRTPAKSAAAADQQDPQDHP